MRATDYLEAHQLGSDEFVLDREVTVVQVPQGQIHLAPPPARRLFALND